MLKKPASCVCGVAMSLLRSDDAVIVNSPSAHFIMIVMTDVALALRSDGLGSISIFRRWEFGPAQQRSRRASLLHWKRVLPQ